MLSELFEDSFTPHSYNPNRVSHYYDNTPEFKLLREILDSAVNILACALKRKRRNGRFSKSDRKLVTETLEWFLDEPEPNRYVCGYTYEECCDHLRLNTSYIRNRVLTQFKNGTLKAVGKRSPVKRYDLKITGKERRKYKYRRSHKSKGELLKMAV
jgi:hypothetical protein